MATRTARFRGKRKSVTEDTTDEAVAAEKFRSARRGSEVDEQDVAAADEKLAVSKDLPAPAPTAPTPDDPKSTVADRVDAGSPDLGQATDGLVDDPVADPSGPRLSPSVGGDVLGSVGPDVTPTFDPRPGSADDAVGAATSRTGLDPDAKTPDEFADLRPDSGGTAGFIDIIEGSPEPAADGLPTADGGIDPEELDGSLDFLRDHLRGLGYSDREVESIITEAMEDTPHHGSHSQPTGPNRLTTILDEQYNRQLFGANYENSPNDLKTDFIHVSAQAHAIEMEQAKAALIGNGYSEAEAEDLTSPPRGGWMGNVVIRDGKVVFTPKPELTKALAEIEANAVVEADDEEVVSEEKEVVADEEEVVVSDEEEVVSDEKVVGEDEAEEEEAETVFLGGGAEARGDQNVTADEEDEKEAAGSGAEDASRPDSEFKDPRIEKQGRDLEEDLGAGSRDPRSGAIDPFEFDVVEKGEPSRVITTDDLAQPLPDGDGEGGTREANGSDDTGPNAGGAINPTRDADVEVQTTGLRDDPGAPAEALDRDREDDPVTSDAAPEPDPEPVDVTDADPFAVSRMDAVVEDVEPAFVGRFDDNAFDKARLPDDDESDFELFDG